MKGYVSIAKYQELEAKYAAAEFRLQQLERMIFGAKSERFYGDTPPDEQLNLFTTDTLEEQPNEPTQTVEKHERKLAKPKKKPARQALPEHLPRKENIILPEGLTDKIGQNWRRT